MRNLLLLSILFSVQQVWAQVDSINVSTNKLLIAKLTPGKRSYAVWQENEKSGKLSQVSIWNREIKFQKIRGKEVIVVEQFRSYSDSINNKYVITMSDRSNLRTIYDYTQRIRTGVEAFNYEQNRIVGADTVKGNSKNGFIIEASDMPYCFEMDLETLGILPIEKVGQQFQLNFYHPGGSIPPQYYPVEVLSKETITVSKEQTVPCWKIKLTYSADSYDISWIGMNTHEVLKLEGHYPGMIFHKTKLISSAF